MRCQIVKVTTNVTLITEECYKCGVIFGMTEQMYRQRQSTGQDFYCPNGHSQHYVGESDKNKAKRLEKELEQSKRLGKYFEDAYSDEAKEHRATKRSLSARKAVNTKLKNRIKKGLCPKCHEHFTNLQEHMDIEHPDYCEDDLA